MTEAIKPGLVLLADDDASNRDILRRRLERRGYEIVEAENGQVALALIEERPFDLVLLDHLMLDLSGLEVLSRIRAVKTADDLPVIMVTGKTFKEDLDAAMSRGANDYVTKPVNFATTLPRIEAEIRRKRESN